MKPSLRTPDRATARVTSSKLTGGDFYHFRPHKDITTDMVGTNTIGALQHGAQKLSKRLVASYILDWVLIIATVGVGGGLSKVRASNHAFSLDDPNISFPYTPDTVPILAVLICALVAPGIITAVICLLLVPGAAAARGTPKALVWRRKVWEWNTAWLGLGVSLAGAFFTTEGLKDIYGKPRPDLLDRCQPDLNRINDFRVGGLGKNLDSSVPIMVTWKICTNPDLSILRDGFTSFPSGHASFTWAGMAYLTLFLCAKFAIVIPYLSPAAYSRSEVGTFDEGYSKNIPRRNQAAAPPTWVLILAYVPICISLYVSGTRWSDYRHHGFDIISGSIIGFVFAYFGFRLYHLPIQQGSGWSWGPRSRDRAYYIGVGLQGYVGDEGWASARYDTKRADVENGMDHGDGILGAGLEDYPQREMTNGGERKYNVYNVDGANGGRAQDDQHDHSTRASTDAIVRGEQRHEQDGASSVWK